MRWKVFLDLHVFIAEHDLAHLPVRAPDEDLTFVVWVAGASWLIQCYFPSVIRRHRRGSALWPSKYHHRRCRTVLARSPMRFLRWFALVDFGCITGVFLLMRLVGLQYSWGFSFPHGRPVLVSRHFSFCQRFSARPFFPLRTIPCAFRQRATI